MRITSEGKLIAYSISEIIDRYGSLEEAERLEPELYSDYWGCDNPDSLYFTGVYPLEYIFKTLKVIEVYLREVLRKMTPIEDEVDNLEEERLEIEDLVLENAEGYRGRIANALVSIPTIITNIDDISSSIDDACFSLELLEEAWGQQRSLWEKDFDTF